MNSIKDTYKQLETIKNTDIEQFTLNGYKTQGKIVDIHDGDTCRIVLIFCDLTLKKFDCRLVGLDTPEIRPLKSKPNRDVEILNANRARNRLIQLGTNCECSDLNKCLKDKDCKSLLDTNTKIINVECLNFDKYGRLLVKLNSDNIYINQCLIDEGFANPYDGGTKETFNF